LNGYMNGLMRVTSEVLVEKVSPIFELRSCCAKLGRMLLSLLKESWGKLRDNNAFIGQGWRGRRSLAYYGVFTSLNPAKMNIINDLEGVL